MTIGWFDLKGLKISEIASFWLNLGQFMCGLFPENCLSCRSKKKKKKSEDFWYLGKYKKQIVETKIWDCKFQKMHVFGPFWVNLCESATQAVFWE